MTTTHLLENSAKTLDSKDVNLEQYIGDVVLIVNTASQCGLTPQYKDLQALHDTYAAKGLRILGFPCNQFGEQEPGSATEIGAFCQKNYGVTFQMFDKIEVNGPDAHPIYKQLTGDGKIPVEWNFAKFVVARDGKTVKRYSAKTPPTELIPEIERLLSEPK